MTFTIGLIIGVVAALSAVVLSEARRSPQSRSLPVLLPKPRAVRARDRARPASAMPGSESMSQAIAVSSIMTADSEGPSVLLSAVSGSV